MGIHDAIWQRGGARAVELRRADARATAADTTNVRYPLPRVATFRARRSHHARARCRTTIVHGTHDPTVPIDLSRTFAALAPQLCKLVEVDDDHALTRPHTLHIIAAETRELFNDAGHESGPGRDDAAAAPLAMPMAGSGK